MTVWAIIWFITTGICIKNKIEAFPAIYQNISSTNTTIERYCSVHSCTLSNGLIISSTKSMLNFLELYLVKLYFII